MPKLPDSGFDRVASFYDALAHFVFGDKLQRAQLALLPHVPDKAKVLLIGGGTGWLLEQLLATPKQLDILYLEASPKMLRKARRRYHLLPNAQQATVSFRLGTEQALQPNEEFTVIITPFLLDLFPEQRLHQLMRRLAAALAPDGLWLFSDFWPVQVPAPFWQRLLVKSMYGFFGKAGNVQATQLPAYKKHFDALYLQEKYSYTFISGLVQTKVFGQKEVQDLQL